ncbi:MAG: hypothetical protein NTY75_01370 [Candidatus Shapirobacteria bacterium]|nr:hypothetical protein [Candidatus Shapirobacteria bacterium]
MEDLIIKISRVFFGFALAITVFISLEVWLINHKNIPNDQAQLTVLENKKVAINSAVEVSAAADIKTTEITDDARPILIKKYLEKYKSPLAPYSDMIFQLSQTYGFDYYWIVAIAQQESNLCKKIPDNSHNCWGYGINSAGTLKFDNYELALKSYAEYLKTNYFDKGLNTPELIMKKYCPHSNGSWAYGVNQFIQEIESGSF